jgi:ribokinase
MPDVVVCGSLNMDVIAFARRLPHPGETLSDARLEYAPGGKGANQAVAAARLGADTALVGAHGDDDFGRAARAAVEAAGVDSSGLRQVGEPTGVALIVVGEDGENQIVVAPGANRCPCRPSAGLRAAVWVTQGETPVETAQATLDAARASGGLAIVNAAPAGRLPAELVRQFDLAVVNQTELDALGEGHPAAVLLTMGGEGAQLLPDGPTLPAYPAQVVDTTGAGDALIGGLAAGLAAGMPLAEAVRLGMATAAVSVERRGAQTSMPNRAEVDARMALG